jgi:Flp pilus assembly protein TadG
VAGQQRRPIPALSPPPYVALLIRRLRGRRDERGVVSTWTILMASGVFLVLLGLVYDGGNAMNNRIAAHRAAEQAARAAADEMRGVRDGAAGINQATATARANQILAQAGRHGTVSIDGLDVTVRVIGRSDNAFLNAIGFDSFPVDETGTATSITGPN